ncbi:hypothetical protein LTR36_009256 [Oleoguttula mirabilis]|uniref:Inositolphosphotransferase Aur1/Ipt1 domain-containing protein n=1 Tax=Oleoguttula mirabilis TaxID=1507867 RepID=A0AAV9J5Z4_9PEZI|nr:hypothetical protein LTR36_009256 [Oleoguttula mirabilis]
MLGSLIINRRRSYSITRPRKSRETSSENLLGWRDPEYDSEASSLRSRSPSPLQKPQQHVRGIPVESSDSNRFANHIHSRILQKYPFIIEMFYWALNFVAYAMTKKLAGIIYGRGGHHVTELAQENGINILKLEHDSILSIFFPIGEAQLQQFLLNNHKPIMTFFNQIYSLVHIPGTVAFLSWYYYAAPSHTTFAVARRTMTLGNFAAFIIFCFYPCMPPRLLPASFGFQDTVRQGNAESVWVGGANVNQLAAMPSLHFTYAFVISCTFFHHSGFLQLLQGQRTPGAGARSTLRMVGFMLMGVLYPLLVLTVIVATANHYYFDAVVATASVTLSLLCNRVWLLLLPAERLLFWALRVKKPVPTTGQRYGTGEEETNERVKVTVV